MIVPSLLSADFSRLEESLRAVERAGVDMVSVDVMDGHFVPNLTFGPIVVKAVRKLTHLLVENHLMITDPDAYAPAFAKAGADYITFHAEASADLKRTVDIVTAAGTKVGIAVKPDTPLGVLEQVMEGIDILLLMTVHPGFGGQEFLEEVLPKIEEARTLRDRHGWPFMIMVDGGVNEETAPLVVSSGAELLVAGSAVFGSGDIEEAVRRLKKAAGGQS